jgi:hypothetical protein
MPRPYPPEFRQRAVELARLRDKSMPPLRPYWLTDNLRAVATDHAAGIALRNSMITMGHHHHLCSGGPRIEGRSTVRVVKSVLVRSAANRPWPRTGLSDPTARSVRDRPDAGDH